MKRIKDTSINSKYRNFKITISNIIFWIGIIFLVYGIGQTVYDYIQEQNKIEINGTISQIEYGNSNVSKITVKYEVNRMEYQQVFNVSEEVTVNDEYPIIYNKNKPGETINNEHIIEVSISLVVFMISMALGLKDFIINMTRNKRIEKIKTEGILIKPSIQEIMINNKAHKYNKQHPFVIRLVYINPQDNQTYIYKTENIYEDIRSTIERTGIKTIDVYINKNKTDDYYIDLDSIMRG